MTDARTTEIETRTECAECERLERFYVTAAQADDAAGKRYTDDLYRVDTAYKNLRAHRATHRGGA